MQKQHPKIATDVKSPPYGSPRPIRHAVPEAYLKFEASTVSKEDIRRRAYQKWERAGKPNGDGIKFWLEAEQELRHRI